MTQHRPTSRARALRAKPSNAERLLWARLRKKQLHGARFRRQHPMGAYVVDFVCLAKGLVIEVDGDQHCEPAQMRHDGVRDQWLAGEGYRVLRFPTREVYDNIDGVVGAVVRALENAADTPTWPRPGSLRA